MPRPDGGAQTLVNKGGSITFTDYRGRSISQSLKGAGGDVSRGDVLGLANLIADASNATYTRVEARNREEWKDADLIFFDEAESSVSEVIVINLLHDTNPSENQEVIIPAFDASLLVAGTNQVNISDARIVAIANAALGIVNDDDNPLNPDNYHDWNAYTTTRKVSNNKGAKVRNLPAPIEATNDDDPGDEPGNLP